MSGLAGPQQFLTGQWCCKAAAELVMPVAMSVVSPCFLYAVVEHCVHSSRHVHVVHAGQCNIRRTNA
jgi:hypothetical protein